VLPDYASVNFHEDGATALAGLLLSRGVAIEAGLASPPAAEPFAASGRAGGGLRVLLEPQEGGSRAALERVAGVETVLDDAGVMVKRLLHGTDGTTWPLIDDAAARGYDTRVGFEDTLTLPDGARAPSNAVLVAEACRRIGERRGRR